MNSGPNHLTNTRKVLVMKPNILKNPILKLGLIAYLIGMILAYLYTRLKHGVVLSMSSVAILLTVVTIINLVTRYFEFKPEDTKKIRLNDKAVSPWQIAGVVLSGLILSMTLTATQAVNSLLERPTITQKQVERLVHPPKPARGGLMQRLNNYPDTILPTIKAADKILESDDNQMFIFFKVGCPYCEKAHSTIDDQIYGNRIKQAHYVNVESEVGQYLVKKFNVTKSTTIVVNQPKTKTFVSKQMFKILPTGLRENEPDTKGINEMFQLLKTP